MEIFLWAAVVSENNTIFGSRRFSAQSQWISISAGWKFTAKVLQVPWSCQGAALGWGMRSGIDDGCAGNEFHEVSSSQSWNMLCFCCFSWVQALCGHTATLWEGVFHVGANCGIPVDHCASPGSGTRSLLGFVMKAESRSSLQSHTASCKGGTVWWELITPEKLILKQTFAPVFPFSNFPCKKWIQTRVFRESRNSSWCCSVTLPHWNAWIPSEVVI